MVENLRSISSSVKVDIFLIMLVVLKAVNKVRLLMVLLLSFLACLYESAGRAFVLHPCPSWWWCPQMFFFF